MKVNLPEHRRKAFTALELLVVLAVIFTVFVLLVLPGIMNRPKHRGSAAGIKCSSNLKQIALSFKMFAGDNNSQFPYKARGSLAYTNDAEAWLHFQALSNELGSAKVLFCPSDVGQKSPANSFAIITNQNDIRSLPVLKNTAISYFVGLDAKDDGSDTWLAGDGQVSNASHGHKGPLLFVNDPAKLRWLQPTHAEEPSVAQASGRVQRGSHFTNNAAWPTNTANRLLLPQ